MVSTVFRFSKVTVPTFGVALGVDSTDFVSARRTVQLAQPVELAAITRLANTENPFQELLIIELGNLQSYDGKKWYAKHARLQG
jgi:hypothetical protein